MSNAKNAYKLTVEHKAKIPAIVDKWAKNSISTYQPTEEELHRCKREVRQMYKCAGLTPPPDHRIAIVSSPFVARFAAGFATAIWLTRGRTKKSDYLNLDPGKITGETAAETYATILAVTQEDSGAPSSLDSRFRLYGKIENQFGEMTSFAKEFLASLSPCEEKMFHPANVWGRQLYSRESIFWHITGSAVWQSILGRADNGHQLKAASCKVNGDMSALCDALGCDLGYALSYSVDDGWVNGYSNYETMTDFVHTVARPQWDWRMWESYYFLSQHLGEMRYMNERFTIISRKPVRLHFNANKDLHCDGDASCEWADGSKVYALNGVCVPDWLALTPADLLTPEDYKRIDYSDIREQFVLKFGEDRKDCLGIHPEDADSDVS